MMPFMDDATWQDFAENHFEKSPTVLRGWGVTVTLSTEKELFELLASFPDQTAPGTLRFFDGPAKVDDPFRCLPNESDGSLEAFVERAARELCSGGQFGLFVSQVSELSALHWRRARAFVQALFTKVGHPPGPTSMQMFLSKYAHTPFGVHKDDASIFHAVVRGPKRMLLWPYEALAHHVADGSDMRREGYVLEELAVEDVRSSAIVLEGQTGDVLYWPSTYWHVAEEVPGTSYSLSLNVGVALTQPRHVLECLTERLMRASLADPSAIHTAVDARGEVTTPREIAVMIERLRALLDSGEIERSLCEGWMEHVSSSGFDERPDALPSCEIDASDVVAIDGGERALWRRSEAGLVVCANGITIYFERDGGITSLLASLNSGRAVPVSELLTEVARHEDAWDPATIGAFLSALHQARTLSVTQNAT
jgi:hypothetical protein